jgi:hypothetical protein
VTNAVPLTSQVVHLDFIALSETATAEAVEDLISEAAGLTQIDSVQLAGVIQVDKAASNGGQTKTAPTLERAGSDLMASASGVSPQAAASDFDLAFFFVLDRFTSLEPFGTDPRYIRFLQGKAARILRAFAGADIALTAPFPEVGPYAACLALMAPDQTYDWEVRSALESWTRSQAIEAQPSLSREGADNRAANAIGLAIGERQRYRGCVLSFTTTASTPGRLADRRFESTLIAGRATRF